MAPSWCPAATADCPRYVRNGLTGGCLYVSCSSPHCDADCRSCCGGHCTELSVRTHSSCPGLNGTAAASVCRGRNCSNFLFHSPSTNASTSRGSQGQPECSLLSTALDIAEPAAAARCVSFAPAFDTTLSGANAATLIPCASASSWAPSPKALGSLWPECRKRQQPQLAGAVQRSTAHPCWGGGRCQLLTFAADPLDERVPMCLTAGAMAPPTNPYSIAGSNLQYMSSYGYNTTIQKGWCNLGIGHNVTKLVQGFAASGGVQRGLIELYGQGIFNVQHGGGIKGLKPDWEQRWAAIFATMLPGLRSGALAGVFIGDELTLWGCSVAYISQVASRVKADFAQLQRNDLIIYTNAAPLSLRKYYSAGVPANLTHFSVDLYETSIRNVRGFYQQFVYPKLGPETEVWVVPGAFASRARTRDDERRAQSYLLGHLYWAKLDHRVTGMK